VAKYVCDFAQVRANGEKLCQIASQLSSAINTYSSNIESSLSSWSGDASVAFQGSNSAQVKASLANAQYINSLGEFVKSAADSIESLEGELSGLSI